MTEERPTEPASANDATESPTPPSYTPGYTPPPIPPPVAPQPTVAWAPPPAATAAAGQRTTLSLAAGVLLVILGVLGALASLALLTIGREFIRQFDMSSLPGLEQISDPNAFVESAATFGGIIVLAFSTFYVIGGVGVMRSRDWGRVIGIVIGILAGLFWLASLGGRGGGSTPIVLLAVHAYIAIALLFYWRNKAPA
jgi:hypothetical protein